MKDAAYNLSNKHGNGLKKNSRNWIGKKYPPEEAASKYGNIYDATRKGIEVAKATKDYST